MRTLVLSYKDVSFTECLNQLGWKRTLRSSNPAYDLIPTCQLDHGAE